MEGDSFSYVSLAGSPQDPVIRLLEILPGQPEQTIHLSMLPKRLKDAGHYEALSYSWGGTWDAYLPVSIVCNDARLVINTSLHRALRHLRYIDRPRMIWADAICINQGDDDEKTQQVQCMHDIYRNATAVVIWLGEDLPNKHGEMAMALVPHLVEAREDAVERLPKDILALADRVKVTNEVADRKENLEPWNAFVELLNRPWFGRVWIIQEVSVASNAIIVCGNSSLPWRNFLKALLFVVQTPTLKTVFPTGTLQVSRVMGLLNASVSYKSLGAQSLFKLLVQHRACDATEPKDKVFALCGIANDCGADHLNLAPDYRLDVKKVYTNVAIAILKNSQDLDLLAVPRVSSPSSSLGLPSWAPNWSQYDLARTFCFPDCTFRAAKESTSSARIFQLSNDTNPQINLISRKEEATFQGSTNFPIPPQFIECCRILGISNILSVSGFPLDRIVSVGALWDLDPSSNGFINVPQAQTIYHSWESVSGARSNSIYINGEPILDAYYKTLQAGNPPEEYDATSTQRQQWDTQSKRFRLLHRLGVHKHTKTYLGASWALMAFHISSDIYHERPSGALAPGLRLTIVPCRRMFRTEKGYIGLGPHDVREGDEIALFKGSKVPLAVRANQGLWELVGDSYVHGVMSGEAFDEQNCSDMWFI